MKEFIHSKWMGAALAALGVAAIVYGIYRDEVQVVFTKAIHICTECIGIG